MVVRQDYDKRDENATNENTTDCLYLMPYITNRETKELLPYSIFIITRRYKRVEIQRCNRRVVA